MSAAIWAAGALSVAFSSWPAPIAQPRPIDLIEIDSVRWDDGTYDGTPPFPHVDAAIEGELGQRLQLRRIIDVLRQTLAGPGADGELLASARRSIDALKEPRPTS
jgi:hypothetical protein